MEAVFPLTDERVLHEVPRAHGVVAASQVSRRYGDGETAVDALREVDRPAPASRR